MPWQKLPDLPACPCSACVELGQSIDADVEARVRGNEPAIRAAAERVTAAAARVDARHGLATMNEGTP